MRFDGRLLAWCALIFGVTGTALTVVPWFAGGTEMYTTPKLAMLVLGALLATFTRRLLPAPVQLRFIDLAWGAHLGFGLLSGLVNGPVWSVPATWFLPLAAATLLVGALSLLKSEEGEERVLQLIIVTTVMVAAVAMLEACDIRLPWSGTRRPHSTLGNRNFVAADAAVGLTLALSSIGQRAHVARLAAIALLAAVVTLTRCRSVWAGLAVAALVAALITLVHALQRQRARRDEHGFATRASRNVWAWLTPLIPRRAVALGLAAAILGGSLGGLVRFPGLHWRDDGVISSAARMLEIEKGSGRGRLDDYVLASAMLRERPLLGWGPRRWEDASSAVAHDVAERHASAYVFWPTPNSDLARIAGEQGLAGLLTLGALLLALGHAAYRRLRVETHLLHESMGFTVLLGLSVYGVNALLDAPLFRPSSVAVIACLCALLRGTSPALTCIPQRLSARVAVAAGFVLVILAGVRVSAAAIIRHGDGSIEARTTAQRFWPRPGVQQAIVVSLANAGKCAEAEEAAETALIWTPHHWAAPHFVALCLRRAGDHERSLELRQRALAIEPHLDALIAHHRQASGDLRIDHPPRHGSKQDADALEANARF